MSAIQNFDTYDPFADEGLTSTSVSVTTNEKVKKKKVKDKKIHIRVQKRNGRKSVTTISGLSKKFNFQKILKTFRKELYTSGSIVNDEESDRKIIQLFGDVRTQVKQFFIDEGIALEQDVIVHGY
mmetsp:Transcript_2602/g.3748  ORF Transcript_2602/g.3748 Transcript_2602/m.3748 type:complete len:125 (+) Transcript_2602:53-427(+)